MTDTLDRIIAYEQGELDEDEVIALFQHLVDSGLAWQLQGHYGRTALALLEQGLLARPACPSCKSRGFHFPGCTVSREVVRR